MLNKTLLKSAAVAFIAIWAANNVEPVKKLVGPKDGGSWF